MKLSHHAKVRAQQRSVPPLVMEWLLAYGTRRPSHGAEVVAFDRRARRELERDMGAPIVRQLARYLNVRMVIDPSSEALITVMWTH